MKPDGSLRIEQNASYGIVVDASVAIKWHLRDELLSSEATALLEEFATGRLRLTAPALIRYEMASALENARRRARISDNDSFVELEAFLQYGIDERADSGELVAAAQRVAFLTGTSVYDAIYVSHAETRGYDLVTSDKALLRRLESYPVKAFNLADFEVPS